MPDVVVVGAGPNGLAAAITCAEAGRSVVVLEGQDVIGGGTQTREVTLPGFRHDICSAIHPFAAVSPFFRSAELQRHGLELLHPEVCLTHPLDGGRAGVLHRSAAETAAGLGVDGPAWDRFVTWVADRWERLAPSVLGPLARVPRHPFTMAAFGLRGVPPASWLQRAFSTEEAKGLLAGCAAHTFLPLGHAFTSAMGLTLLASAHIAGWPVAKGGSSAISDAMAARLHELGGTIEVGRPVRSLADLPDSRAVLFDVTPRQLLQICGDALPPGYRRRMGGYRYGPGAFKVDYALSGPVPWLDEASRRAGSVHVGGSFAEIAAAEAEVTSGRHPERPFVLVGQQSLVDPTRAPAGQHTLWAYCHVPNGSDVDMADVIERQIERFAPGFRDLVLARWTAGPPWYEQHDESMVGGDINGGSFAGPQLLLRPRPGVPAYATPDPRFFVCGQATPPGGGVHGMCGYNAARQALRTTLR